MAKEVIMPVFGFTQEDSQIVSWLVKEGSEVTQGDPIAEVTTDKINMEIEAPATGILGGIQFSAGETVPVTTVIAYILEPGESPPLAPSGLAKTAKSAAPETVADQQPAVFDEQTTPPVAAHGVAFGVVTPLAARLLSDIGGDAGQITGTGIGGRITRRDVENFLNPKQTSAGGKVRATPAARHAARERGLDLATIKGSGPHGRVQEADIRGLNGLPPQALASRTTSGGGVIRIPLTQMRRTIAANLQHSAQQAPHIYFQADTDMTALADLVLEGNRDRNEDEAKVTITSVLAKAVAWTLTRHRRLNSNFLGEEILQFEDVNLGIAVALEDGLIVPVIHQANRKSILVLSMEVQDLAQRARGGRLKPDDLRGATFTISNLGMYKIDRFTAIINPPEVAILAVGRAERQFVPDNYGQPIVRQIVTLTLSVDHRVVDGAVAAAFLDELRTVCEKPHLMSL